MEIRSYRPEGFTEEPFKDLEHMHTGLIKDIPALEEVYIDVSNDDGSVLDDFNIEEEARRFYKLLPKIQRGYTEGLELEEIKRFTTEYSMKINKASSIKNGAIAKYRIRQGAQFIILKILVKKSRQLWEVWFKDNFKGIINIRFAQQCMQLAKIPNIIRYSVFGIPRLLEIIRAIDVNNNDDPIGDFLNHHKILFDPETEPDIEGDKIRVDAIKINIDTIISIRKLEENGLNNIDEGILRTLVATNKNFKFKILRGKLQNFQANAGEPNEYLRKLSLNGGVEPNISLDELRPHLDRIGAEWVESAEKYLNEPEHLSTIDYRIIDKIWELASKIKEMRTPLGK